jgi:predicted RNase H-like HicB family nuclease
MPTRAEALAELEEVYRMLEEEYRERNIALLSDSIEVVHA